MILQSFQIGYEKNLSKSTKQPIDQQLTEIKAKVEELKKKFNNSEYYKEVSYCVIYHEHVLKFESKVLSSFLILQEFFFHSFCHEVQDIFKGPIFAQLMASCIIICMTCFMMVIQLKTNPPALMSSVPYLITMITQVLLFCWIGNELIYSVSKNYLVNF